MHLVSGLTVSDTVYQMYNTIVDKGHYRTSRNGGCTSIFDATFEVRNPRSRHLCLRGRKSNIFAMIAETFWVMAGEDKLYPYLTFFLPRAPQYSDDGETWSGAYGPRLYDNNQLASIPDLFRRDTEYTRRAWVAIHDPRLDSTQGIEDRFGAGELGKDRPCNLGINFYVIRENEFVTKVVQRSGDSVFGTGSINPFEFSFLHELMFNEVKKDYPNLELGPYRWHVTNAHLYDFTKSQAMDVLSEDSNRVIVADQNHMPLIGPSVGQWQGFFRDIVGQLSEAIETDEPEYVCGTLISHLGHSFVEYQIPLENNLLWFYVQAVAHYVADKRGVTMSRPLDCVGLPREVYRPIYESTFRKFRIVS